MTYEQFNMNETVKWFKAQAKANKHSFKFRLCQYVRSFVTVDFRNI